MKEFIDYANVISRELCLDYNKVLHMTLEEINKISSESFEEAIKERMENESWRKTLYYLIPDYDFLYEHLGEALIRGFSLEDDSFYIKYRRLYSDDIHKYDDCPEKKKYVFDDGNGCGYKEKYIEEYRLSEGVENAISFKFPELIKFSPSFYSSYNAITIDSEINFNIKIGTNESGDDKIFYFRCSLCSFLLFDTESMLEDYLDYNGFHRIRSKESDRYIAINNNLNSDAVKEFFDIIKSIKEKKENVSP